MVSQGGQSGIPGAELGLGVAYHNGEGMQKDPEEAVKMVTKAAVQGNAMAQSNLANAYFTGEGVAKDAAAAGWYAKAADNGNLLGTECVWLCLSSRARRDAG